jgi:hypothetical protein
VRHPRHFDMQIDAIEQRPRKAGLIALQHRRRANAFVLRIALETAGTPVRDRMCKKFLQGEIGLKAMF